MAPRSRNGGNVECYRGVGGWSSDHGPPGGERGMNIRAPEAGTHGEERLRFTGGGVLPARRPPPPGPLRPLRGGGGELIVRRAFGAATMPGRASQRTEGPACAIAD